MIAESQSMAEERAQQGRIELEQSLMAHVDDRMTAIARLIRSDNQALAERLAAMPEPADRRRARRRRGARCARRCAR